MPYLPEERKKELMLFPERANCVGDYNFLYTLAYLEAFKSEMRYVMIHKIAEASIWPSVVGVIAETELLLLNLGVSYSERSTARMLAFEEFYARIGRLYEEEAICRNGDLNEYIELEQLVLDDSEKKLSEKAL